MVGPFGMRPYARAPGQGKGFGPGRIGASLTTFEPIISGGLVMDYIFCARNTSGGAFGTNPGSTKFLEIPAAASSHKPDMAIARSDWFRKVIAIAETGKDPLGRPLG